MLKPTNRDSCYYYYYIITIKQHLYYFNTDRSEYSLRMNWQYERVSLPTHIRSVYLCRDNRNNFCKQRLLCHYDIKNVVGVNLMRQIFFTSAHGVLSFSPLTHSLTHSLSLSRARTRTRANSYSFFFLSTISVLDTILHCLFVSVCLIIHCVCTDYTFKLE